MFETMAVPGNSGFLSFGMLNLGTLPLGAPLLCCEMFKAHKGVIRGEPGVPLAELPDDSQPPEQPPWTSGPFELSDDHGPSITRNRTA